MAVTYENPAYQYSPLASFERFRELTNELHAVRFIECGPCTQVLNRVSTIKTLANESDTGIRIGGVIDRDFRTAGDATKIKEGHGVFVLGVHEIENFFLNPQTMSILLEQNGLTTIIPTDLVRDASDLRAGSWIFQHAMSTQIGTQLPEISVAAKDKAKAYAWSSLDRDSDKAVEEVVGLARYDSDAAQKFKTILEASIKVYARKRESPELWKVCEGKQVLNAVAHKSGFKDAPALMLATFAAWKKDPAVVPSELKELREYIASL